MRTMMEWDELSWYVLTLYSSFLLLGMPVDAK
jgi:hypothetical protein